MKKLRALLQMSNVPDRLIQELEVKPSNYQIVFMQAIEQIMRNEVINLMVFMEMKENLIKKSER